MSGLPPVATVGADKPARQLRAKNGHSPDEELRMVRKRQVREQKDNRSSASRRLVQCRQNGCKSRLYLATPACVVMGENIKLVFADRGDNLYSDIRRIEPGL